MVFYGVCDAVIISVRVTAIVVTAHLQISLMENTIPMVAWSTEIFASIWVIIWVPSNVGAVFIKHFLHEGVEGIKCFISQTLQLDACIRPQLLKLAALLVDLKDHLQKKAMCHVHDPHVFLAFFRTEIDPIELIHFGCLTRSSDFLACPGRETTLNRG